MKRNIVTDILLNFDQVSQSKKLGMLQDFENTNAKKQARKPRIITTIVPQDIKDSLKNQNAEASGACYDRRTKKKIYILDDLEKKINPMDYDPLNSGPIYFLNLVEHEGWHAYVDDYVNKTITLKTCSKIDKDRFFDEQKYFNVIRDYCNKKGFLYICNNCHSEERVNYHENTLNLTKYIIDAIENTDDMQILEDDFIHALYFYAINERMIKDMEKSIKCTYDEVYANATAEVEDQTRIIDMQKAGKIIDNIDEEHLNFINAAVEKVNECINVQFNRFLSQENQIILYNEKIDNLREFYRKHIIEQLQKKHYS